MEGGGQEEEEDEGGRRRGRAGGAVWRSGAGWTDAAKETGPENIGKLNAGRSSLLL